MVEPILITGCPRSGTSLIAGVVSHCGAFGGELVKGNPNNPKGFFENGEVRTKLLKPYLKSIGADPMGQDPLPTTVYFPKREGWAEDVREIFISQGYEEGPWFYKEPKMCLIWSVWAEAFPLATWVIVRRNSYSIAHSCSKTSFMRRYKTPEDWLPWVAEHVKRLEQIKRTKKNVIEVWPEHMYSDDLKEYRALVDFLGLSWAGEKVEDFISPLEEV